MRVKISGAFGLLPQDLCAVLDSFREVRNYCAHAIKKVSLDDSKIVGPIQSLRKFSMRHIGTLAYESLVRHATTELEIPDSEELREFARQRVDEHAATQHVSERAILIIAAAYLSGYIRGIANLKSPQDFRMEIPPALPPLVSEPGTE